MRTVWEAHVEEALAVANDQEAKNQLLVGQTCDRCGAEAFVYVRSRLTGGHLTLCGHHGAIEIAHVDALITGADDPALEAERWLVINQRHLIRH